MVSSNTETKNVIDYQQYKQKKRYPGNRFDIGRGHGHSRTETTIKIY